MESITLRKADRKKAKLRIGLAGPSGSGKTYSALLMASGMADWDKIALIDTENHSGDLYAHLGDYNVIEIDAPFEPEKYAQAIKAAEDAGMQVIIVDSVSHVWEGEGGTMEIVDRLGGRFQDWAKATPRYRKFLNSILQSKSHVICTMRSKQDYAMTQEAGGKAKVEKLGMKPVIREGFEYEMTISLDISIKHYATSGKDRTGLFMDRPEFIIIKDTGEEMRNWADEGTDERAELEADIDSLLKQIGRTRDFLEGHADKAIADMSNQEMQKYINQMEVKIEDDSRSKYSKTPKAPASEAADKKAVEEIPTIESDPLPLDPHPDELAANSKVKKGAVAKSARRQATLPKAAKKPKKTVKKRK